MLNRLRKVDEGRRESETRIKAITQRASELSANVESLRGELTSRNSRISELERKLTDGELAKQRVENQLREASTQVESVIHNASVREAGRKSQIRWLGISLVIAGIAVIALLFALARVNS
jgi:chromosome segregation ATPase